jgi:hypothetical protein
MSKQLPEHPWVEWGKFVKDMESRQLDKDQKDQLAKQKWEECFGSNGFIGAVFHAQECAECQAYREQIDCEPKTS